jgi:hypothetical protein
MIGRRSLLTLLGFAPVAPLAVPATPTLTASLSTTNMFTSSEHRPTMAMTQGEIAKAAIKFGLMSEAEAKDFILSSYRPNGAFVPCPTIEGYSSFSAVAKLRAQEQQQKERLFRNVMNDDRPWHDIYAKLDKLLEG